MPLAQARPLSATEAEAVLRRLPPFQAAGQSSDFSLRESSQPPPRTGQTLDQPFPPPQAPEVPPVAPRRLEVLRKSPEGAVPTAPQLSVTFNQPMVAVTSHQQLADQVPVKLTPQPPGNWRCLIEDQPDNDLIPKLVRGLLSHRQQGHWANTQENCFVLLALDRYFNTYEKATPDFVARIWLGEQFAGEQAFHGRQVDRQNVRVPMSWLAGKPTQNLVLSKTGPGRLYYRLGMEYAPRSLQLDPLDRGFAVERTYEAVDSPQDVTREAGGSWVIRAGARVRVRLTMAAPSRRYHVALVDPMPAGLEALNPSLAVSGDVPADPKERGEFWFWRSTWYEHQNLRDERVEAFTSLLWGGVYDYSYVARATTLGEFVVPPARAEEMYSPETFGRSASDRVIVR